MWVVLWRVMMTTISTYWPSWSGKGTRVLEPHRMGLSMVPVHSEDIRSILEEFLFWGTEWIWRLYQHRILHDIPHNLDKISQISGTDEMSLKRCDILIIFSSAFHLKMLQFVFQKIVIDLSSSVGMLDHFLCTNFQFDMFIYMQENKMYSSKLQILITWNEFHWIIGTS